MFSGARKYWMDGRMTTYAMLIDSYRVLMLELY